MMRPCDFPERKNQRRKAALSRIIGSRSPKTPEARRLLDEEVLALHERIVPSAFHVVTRKFGGPGVLNRRTRQPKATA